MWEEETQEYFSLQEVFFLFDNVKTMLGADEEPDPSDKLLYFEPEGMDISKQIFLKGFVEGFDQFICTFTDEYIDVVELETAKLGVLRQGPLTMVMGCSPLLGDNIIKSIMRDMMRVLRFFFGPAHTLLKRHPDSDSQKLELQKLKLNIQPHLQFFRANLINPFTRCPRLAIPAHCSRFFIQAEQIMEGALRNRGTLGTAVFHRSSVLCTHLPEFFTRLIHLRLATVFSTLPTLSGADERGLRQRSQDTVPFMGTSEASSSSSVASRSVSAGSRSSVGESMSETFIAPQLQAIADFGNAQVIIRGSERNEFLPIFLTFEDLDSLQQNAPCIDQKQSRYQPKELPEDVKTLLETSADDVGIFAGLFLYTYEYVTLAVIMELPSMHDRSTLNKVRSTEARREISVLNSRLSLLEKELDLHSSDGPGNSSLLGMTSPCSNMSFGSMGGNSSMILSPGGNHSMNQSLTGGGPAGSSSFRSHSSFCHSVGGPEARVPDLDFEFLVVDDLHQSSCIGSSTFEVMCNAFRDTMQDNAWHRKREKYSGPESWSPKDLSRRRKKGASHTGGRRRNSMEASSSPAGRPGSSVDAVAQAVEEVDTDSDSDSDDEILEICASGPSFSALGRQVFDVDVFFQHSQPRTNGKDMIEVAARLAMQSRNITLL